VRTTFHFFIHSSRQCHREHSLIRLAEATMAG
jgi:hypothetical protein